MKKAGPEETTLQKIARKTGIIVSRIESLGERYQARYLKRLFPLLDVDLVLDVGGNTGQFARFIRRKVGFTGRIVTFEPLPDLAAGLEAEAAGDGNWQVVQAGVGDHEGQLEFNVMRSSELSSFLQPSSGDTARLAAINQVKTTLSTRIVTIDAYLTEHAAELDHYSSIYLKLDVQGFEGQCLDGAHASLDRISALQAELSVVPIYEGVPPYHEVMRKIEKMGYYLSLVPPHNAAHFPEIIDFDCHFVSANRLRDLGVLSRG